MQRLVTLMVVAGLMLFPAGCGFPRDADRSGSPGAQPVATPVDPDTSVTSGPIGHNDQSDPPAMPPAEPEQTLLDQARALLAKHLGVEDAGIDVVETNQRTWDESLGCPLPGRAYAEFAQFGYLIRLRSGEKTYDVHSNQVGSLVILCDAGRPVLLSGKALPGR